MKVGFAARWSPHDKGSWSGTGHYTYEQIRKRFETEVFHFKWNWATREILTAQKSFNRRWSGKHTSVEFLDRYARYFSRQLTRALKKRPVDCLFVCASSQMIAHVETNIPIVYMTDATFQQLQGYYPGFSNLPAYNVKEGISLDRKAFQNASHCLLASQWCRDSAINDYAIPPGKISIVPCGANLDAIPGRDSLDVQPGQGCRILFLGVDWERKGGDIVLDSYRALRASGIDASLHIVGCVPPRDVSGDPHIRVTAFIDKNDPVQLRELDTVLRQSDFLFLPTRAECAGIVFSEASAYALPSITTNTGGVSTYVLNGMNGFTLPFEAGAAEYAAQIRKILSDRELHLSLKKNARQYYEDHLSWENWGAKFETIAHGLVQR